MKAHELLSDESRWIKGCYVSVVDGSATVCYCAKGALMTAYAGRYGDYLDAVRKLEQRIGLRAIEPWNDHPNRTFEEVRSLLVELDI